MVDFSSHAATTTQLSMKIDGFGVVKQKLDTFHVDALAAVLLSISFT